MRIRMGGPGSARRETSGSVCLRRIDPRLDVPVSPIPHAAVESRVFLFAVPMLFMVLSWAATGCTDATDSSRARGASPPSLAKSTPSAEGPPSVLLLTLDTLRADHLGAYGHPEHPSPVFDAWAARGLLFERAIAASSRTAPSHASIMTGRYVRDHNIQHGNGSTRLGDEPTLAKIFKARGYATAAFVSNAVLQRRIGFDAGFDVYDDELTDREPNRLVFERRAEATVARAVDWLEDAPKPFFLWVHLNDPHGPYAAPKPLRSSGGSLARGEPASFDGSPPVGSPPDLDGRRLPVLESQRGDQGIPAYQALPGVRRVSEYRARYLAEIAYLDQEVGRLVEAIEGAAGSAGWVAAATADHGESFGEDGYFFSHGYATTPNLVHVPLVFWGPDLLPGRTSSLAHHVDILPTLLGLARIEAPFEPAGLDLLAASEPEPEESRRIVFSDVGEEVSAYREAQIERVRVAEELSMIAAGTRQTLDWISGVVWHEAPPEPTDSGATGETARSELRLALDDYLAREGSYILAPEQGDRLTDQLRALGYLEPESEPVAGDR